MKTLGGLDIRWQAVSPDLATARSVAIAALFGAPLLLLSAAMWVLTPSALAALVSVAALVLVTVAIALARRSARAVAYGEGPDELLIRHGRLVQVVVTVPYGRMQLVDLASTPLGRHYGIATVQLHTASATSHARIPGVPQLEAEALRERLVARARPRAEGL